MLPLFLAILSPLQAAPSPQPPSPTAAAGSLGTILYALDRAAWVASDALTAKVPKERLSGVGGWVVERGANDDLIVTFYRGDGDAARAFFVADVRLGKVVASRLLDAELALTPAQQRLARARSTAAAEATARGYRPCTAAPFNTVVLPSTDPQAPVIVYLLTAQVSAETYPIGGHYRVTVGADGRVTASRPFSRSCLNLPVPRATAEQTPAGLFVSHILDRQPVETHVFASLALRLPLFVGTGDTVWQVDGRSITATDMKPAAPVPPPR